FPRLDIKESLLRYGTDKPDLRYELEIADLTGALAGTGFRVFRQVLEAAGGVRAPAGPGGRSLRPRSRHRPVVMARGARAAGLFWLPGGPGAGSLSEAETAAITTATGAGPDDLVLLVADRRRRAETVMGVIRQEIARRFDLVRSGEWRFVWITPT